MTARLEITGLTVRFGGVVAVNDLTVRHATGGVLGLIGPNGAGKTTVINIMSGIIRPTAGEIRLNGRRISGVRPDKIARTGVARTFQNLQTFKSLTVLENVLVPLEARIRTGPLGGLAGALLQGSRLRARALGLLSDVGLAERAEQPVASLPYGDQRRVEVARALAARPRLLLLDEPLAGLSRAESDELTVLIRRVAEAAVTVILVEHDVGAVMRISERVIVLDHGKLLADGTPAQIRDDEQVRAAYLGEELIR